MIEKICKICNNSQITILDDYPSSRLDRVKHFQIIKCISCGTVTTNVSNNKIDSFDLYESEYYKEGLISKAISFLTSVFILIRIFLYKNGSKKILDFGSGRGSFLNFLNRYSNFDTYGLEVSKKPYLKLKKKYGNKVSNADIKSETFFENKTFDIIFMFHVLEHLDDPKIYLKKLRNKLSSDGLMIIEVPDFNSIESKIFRKYFFHLDLPRHLYHFNKNSLEYLLKEINFKSIKFVYSFSFLSFIFCPIYSYENFLNSC